MFWRLTLCLMLTTVFAACGGSQFSGSDKSKSGKANRAGAEGGTGEAPGTGGTTGKSADSDKDAVLIEGEDLSDDDEAINKCLEKFGPHPFAAASIKNYRKISAAVQVFGAGRGIKDDKATPEPELILISAAVNVLGDTTYELLNPNGWYCLKVDVNVLANTTIKLHCNAKLADNKVNVAVLSDAQATGKVGVHVQSKVQIHEVGTCP